MRGTCVTERQVPRLRRKLGRGTLGPPFGATCAAHLSRIDLRAEPDYFLRVEMMIITVRKAWAPPVHGFPMT